VRFFGEDRYLPSFKATGMHCVGEAVGRGAAASDNDAAWCLCA
jgi:hypothetical protein